MLEYSLDKLTDDKLGHNIYRYKEKLYSNIIKFSNQVSNDGIFAENIMRIVFGAINLNHFHKNHPYVDLGVMVPIPGITERKEILSIKSTINYKSMSALLTDTKAVKIESLFSYLLFAYYGFNLAHTEIVNLPVSLLNKAIEKVNKELKNDNSLIIDYKKIVQITTFYLMFHNKKGIENDFLSDINNIIKGKKILKYGTYDQYDNQVNNNVLKLNIPISIGVCYIDKNADKSEGTVCIIKKTNPIQLNTYWNKLLDIWCTRKYFGATNIEGKKVVKYLRYNDICDIYGIEHGNDFPIVIKIKTGNFKIEDNVKTPEEKNDEKKIKRMYIATKFKDADFQDKDYRIIRTFNKMIDILEDEPNLVVKFENFIKEINKKEFKKLSWLTKK